MGRPEFLPFPPILGGQQPNLHLKFFSSFKTSYGVCLSMSSKKKKVKHEILDGKSYNLVNSCLINSLVEPDGFKAFQQNKIVLGVQSVFFCRLLYNLKHSASQFLFSEKTKFLKRDSIFQPNKTFQIKFRIGIIGFGEIGKSVYRHISKYFPSYQILISTRRTELGDYIQQGSKICCDNTAVISESDIIFICVLPNQVNLLLRDIKKVKIPKKRVFCSFVAGLTCTKFSKLMNTKCCITSKFVNDHSYYKSTINPFFVGKDVFENTSFIKYCCPVIENEERPFNLELIGNLYYSFVSILEELKIPKERAIYLSIKSLIGRTTRMKYVVKILNENFLIESSEKYFYKKLDFLQKIFKKDEELRKMNEMRTLEEGDHPSVFKDKKELEFAEKLPSVFAKFFFETLYKTKADDEWGGNMGTSNDGN